MRLRLLPRHLVLVFLAAFSIALPARVLAQAGTSGLTGAVTDPSGTAMDRVHIVVRGDGDVGVHVLAAVQ